MVRTPTRRGGGVGGGGGRRRSSSSSSSNNSDSASGSGSGSFFEESHVWFIGAFRETFGLRWFRVSGFVLHCLGIANVLVVA